MKIITIPHPTLRTVAAPVTQVDKKLLGVIADLEKTLQSQRNPKGVGLAAPQIDIKWRMFALRLPELALQTGLDPRARREVDIQMDPDLRQDDDGRQDDEDTQDDENIGIKILINPQIIDHSRQKSFGANKDDDTLEGCLSVPGVYGPIPRWGDITLQYDVLIEQELVSRTDKFKDFAARVIQHERDHLDGILFTDYTFELGLPLYREDEKTKKLKEISPEMIAALYEKSK